MTEKIRDFVFDLLSGRGLTTLQRLIFVCCVAADAYMMGFLIGIYG